MYFNEKDKYMKKKFLVFIGLLLLNFTGCGSSDDGKALLKHSVQLVGIPQDIVVNICQDKNNNGSCDEGEFQAKVKVKQGDTIAQMWEKVKFDADARHIIENYNPAWSIIMEIDGKKSEKYTNVDLALTYKPQTQELSVLQAVVDADFLKEAEVAKLKSLENREKIDLVLLESLTKNNPENNKLSNFEERIKALEEVSEKRN